MVDTAVLLGTFFETWPLLGRLAFASLELCALVPLLALAIKCGAIRSHRIQSLLWAIVLLNALVAVAFRAPFDLAVLDSASRGASPVAVGSNNLYTPRLLDSRRVGPEAGIPASAVRDIKTAMAAPAGVAPPKAARKAAPWRGYSPAAWLIGFWVAGAGALLAWLLVEQIRLHGLRRRTRAPSRALLAAYEAELEGAARWWTPALRVTEELETPAIAGIVRPVILAPQWLEREGTAEQWAWTLRHELTHWRHGDTLGQMLRLVAQAVFFFHPCVWWAGKRWEESAELACDRALLKTEHDAVGYARELCELLGMIGKRQRPLMSAGLFASRSHIGRRIETLLGDPFSHPDRLRLWQRALTCCALVGLLSVDPGVAGARTEPALPLASAITAAAPPEAGATPGARVLRFPEDYSMGTLQIGGESVDARGAVEAPAGAPVYLRVNDAGAADLSPLANFGATDIQSLSLTGTAVQDEQLAHIQGLTGLTRLELRETPVTDAGMQYLAGMTQLIRLNINSTDVGDEGMRHLGGMTAMQELVLNRTQVGDEGLSYIRNMSNLTYLDMWMLDITDEGMRYLAGLRNLDELGIEDTLITDSGLEFLEGLQRLRRLNLENNNITDAGLASLQKLPNLAEVSLADTYLTDAGMAILARFPALRGAILPVQIGPDGLRRLEGTAVGNYVAGNAGPRRAVTVRITGEGRPLPDARFLLVEDLGPDNEEVHVYRTDATGMARLYMPDRPAPYRLRAFAAGYVTNEAGWDSPAPSDLRLDLERATYIGGTVVDTSGAAVAGVAVSIPVLGGHNWDAQEPLPHAVNTDEGGRWSCDVAPKDLGEFWVSLDHPDYATTTYTVAELPVAALRDGSAVLTIGDAIGLPGLVVDDDDVPIAGARVIELENWRQRSLRATGRVATSDSNGVFEIKPIRPGESVLRIDAAGFVSGAETVNVTAGMPPVRIVLTRGGMLRGRVLDAGGNPLGKIQVSASARSETGVSLGGFSGKTDGEGRFLWSEAPNATISLSFYRENPHAPNGDDYHHLPDVKAGEEEQVFTVPFAPMPQGIAEGQALIDRYNQMHAPEQIGDVAFQFSVEENFDPAAPPKVRTYSGVRAADGRYNELVKFGPDGDERPVWRDSWNGTTYVRHGHPGPGDKGEAGPSDYFVSGEMEEAAHLVALDWLLIFVRDHSYTRRFSVMGYEDGVVTLGDDGEVAMTIRFTDTERLYYDRLEFFDGDGRRVFTAEASDWSNYNDISYPNSVLGRYTYEAMQGESKFNNEMILPIKANDPEADIFAIEIPEDGAVVFDMGGERNSVAAAELDAGLMARKEYLEAVAAWSGGGDVAGLARSDE
ncbi:MAG: carboxypeptidase regulatory-like domain-containing protein [Candidatus Hydrogenedentes bacterium]|nr:carboxypeptidase regulatory-like domain-containing protein [Candidatus Hydrogenedentota bacterium]